MKKIFKSKKRKMQEECWNLSYEFVKWLNEHLKIYVEDKPKIVDMEYFEFDYKGKNYTELEMVNKLIEITDNLISEEDKNMDGVKMCQLKDEMYEILKEIHFTLWW